ncbi:hypothetical protein B0H13DRAFT_2330025 [Mycena leptocephala]|nr:hypothetical protein B0H13DRAFT_2330025 [Mycena leptocephala]
MSNAESNDNDNELHLQPINFNATREELIQALKASQLSVVQLLGELRTLQQENSELRANSTKKRCGGERDVLGYKAHIVGFAKSFMITKALFVTAAVFRANTEPSAMTEPQDQFANDQAYTSSITTKLYEEIPEKFHSLLDAKTYASFAKDFVHEHGEGRSGLIKVIRKALPGILKGYNIDSDLLTTADMDRSKNDVLDRLLRFPNDRKPTLLAPVHRLMFFGPTSLNSGSKPAQNSNGVKLDLKVTEESVSAAGILTRFVLSSDGAWAAKGAISGIDYEQDYRAYHKMLVCNRDAPHVKKILKTVRNFVFSGVAPSLLPGTTSNADADDETEQAISDTLMRFELGIDTTSDPEDSPNRDADAPEPQAPPLPNIVQAADPGLNDENRGLNGVEEDPIQVERPKRAPRKQGARKRV